MWKEAATLGGVEAHCGLAVSYKNGEYGLKKDINMAVHHYEVAAMGGHFGARTISAPSNIMRGGSIGLLDTGRCRLILDMRNL